MRMQEQRPTLSRLLIMPERQSRLAGGAAPFVCLAVGNVLLKFSHRIARGLPPDFNNQRCEKNGYRQDQSQRSGTVVGEHINSGCRRCGDGRNNERDHAGDGEVRGPFFTLVHDTH